MGHNQERGLTGVGHEMSWRDSIIALHESLSNIPSDMTPEQAAIIKKKLEDEIEFVASAISDAELDNEVCSNFLSKRIIDDPDQQDLQNTLRHWYEFLDITEETTMRQFLFQLKQLIKKFEANS